MFRHIYEQFPYPTDVPHLKKDQKLFWALWEELVYYGRYTSMHGFPHMVRSVNKYQRFFWIIYTIFAIGMGGYMFYYTIIGYLQYSVNTNVRITPQTKIKFPMITICNENPFVTPQASEYIREYFHANFDLNVSTFKELVGQLGLNTTRNELNWLIYATNNLTNAEKMKLGYSPEQLFFTFQFSQNDVNVTDLESYYDPIYGACFKVYLRTITKNS